MSIFLPIHLFLHVFIYLFVCLLYTFLVSYFIHIFMHLDTSSVKYLESLGCFRSFNFRPTQPGNPTRRAQFPFFSPISIGQLLVPPNPDLEAFSVASARLQVVLIFIHSCDDQQTVPLRLIVRILTNGHSSS